MSFSLEPLLLMSMGPTCLCSAACVACSASLMLAASGAQNRTGAYTVGGIAVCMAVSGVVDKAAVAPWMISLFDFGWFFSLAVSGTVYFLSMPRRGS